MTGEPFEWRVTSSCGLAALYCGKAWPFRGSSVFSSIRYAGARRQCCGPQRLIKNKKRFGEGKPKAYRPA